MIAALHGTLEGQQAGAALVRVGGFTLLVHVPPSALGQLGAVGQEVHLYTYLHLRQDGLTLYGFATPAQQELFQTLLGVSGVGPRTALSLLSTLTPEQLVGAVLGGDIQLLGRASGVGKKLAERLVVELKGKVKGEGAPGAEDTAAVVAALTSLGYSLAEAREAATLPDPSLPLEEKIRAALQHLAT